VQTFDVRWFGSRVSLACVCGDGNGMGTRVHAGSPRTGGLLRHWARNWGVHEARLGSCVGPVGGHDRAAAPHMRVDVRSGVFNDRHSSRGMAPQVDDVADGPAVMSAWRRARAVVPSRFDIAFSVE
jgi:hypothetical protein